MTRRRPHHGLPSGATKRRQLRLCNNPRDRFDRRMSPVESAPKLQDSAAYIHPYSAPPLWETRSRVSSRDPPARDESVAPCSVHGTEPPPACVCPLRLASRRYASPRAYLAFSPHERDLQASQRTPPSHGHPLPRQARHRTESHTQSDGGSLNNLSAVPTERRDPGKRAP